MNGGLIARAFVVASVFLSMGCASHYRTDQAVVSYNRSLANSRNEILLLNILRASAHEPLQFSAVSQINGSVQNGTKITIPFANIILGGEDSISPSVELTTRNPALTIAPSTSREFVRGMTRPVSFETIRNLVDQGWDRSLVLSLVVGGVVCPGKDRTEVLNNGNVRDRNAQFIAAVAATEFAGEPGVPTNFATLEMSAADAAALLAEGVGEGRAINSIRTIAAEKNATGNEPPPSAATVEVEIVRPGAPRVNANSFVHLCDAARGNNAGTNNSGNTTGGTSATGSASTIGGRAGGATTGRDTGGKTSDDDAAPASPAAGNDVEIILRSPQSIIYYLGALFRERHPPHYDACGLPDPRVPVTQAADASATESRSTQPLSPTPPVLFDANIVCVGAQVPVTAVMATEFRNRHYYVRREVARSSDHTLQVLSLLTELIALQTADDAATAPPPPLIAITPQ